mmetsp:Transcript_15463/g.21337  ORF Transcript_15463/g.21337 Transcript_15463/m.21337 type:complete len:205 (+) Transcript_15463:1178-1792(+)
MPGWMCQVGSHLIRQAPTRPPKEEPSMMEGMNRPPGNAAPHAREESSMYPNAWTHRLLRVKCSANSPSFCSPVISSRRMVSSGNAKNSVATSLYFPSGQRNDTPYFSSSSTGHSSGVSLQEGKTTGRVNMSPTETTQMTTASARRATLLVLGARSRASHPCRMLNTAPTMPARAAIRKKKGSWMTQLVLEGAFRPLRDTMPVEV